MTFMDPTVPAWPRAWWAAVQTYYLEPKMVRLPKNVDLAAIMGEHPRSFDRHKSQYLRWIHPKPPRDWHPTWASTDPQRFRLPELQAIESRLTGLEHDVRLIKASFSWLYVVLTTSTPPSTPAF